MTFSAHLMFTRFKPDSVQFLAVLIFVQTGVTSMQSLLMSGLFCHSLVILDRVRGQLLSLYTRYCSPPITCVTNILNIIKSPRMYCNRNILALTMPINQHGTFNTLKFFLFRSFRNASALKHPLLVFVVQ